jgi:putative transposase
LVQIVVVSSKYQFRDQDKLYFVSFAVVYWIDLFTRIEYKDIMLKSWRHCINNKGMELYGWCNMTSHVHMILGSHGSKMEDIMRDMKRHTSEELKREIAIHLVESRRECLPAG